MGFTLKVHTLQFARLVNMSMFHSFGAIQIVEKKSKSYEKTYLVLLYMQVQKINVYADFLDTSVKRPDKSSHMGSLL